jgi:hypothetical protein
MRHSANAYNVATICEPTIILPSQWWERSRAASSPEMRLVAAVLENAIDCIVKNVGARRGPRLKDFTDACTWVFEDRPDWPFSFANVCDILNLDPTAVRERVRRVLDAQRDTAQSSARVPLTSVGARGVGPDRLGQHWRQQEAG